MSQDSHVDPIKLSNILKAKIKNVYLLTSISLAAYTVNIVSLAICYQNDQNHSVNCSVKYKQDF